MLSEPARRGLARLAGGNRRFVQSVAEAVGPDRLETVLSTADPFAVVLGCADSRVVPEIVFGETLGQLFVVRVAGNVPANAELASIEYAISTWSCPLLIVLGHTRCGAVGAALDPAIAEAPPDLGRTAHLASLLVEVRANLGLAMAGGADGDDDDRWGAAVRANVLSAAGALVRRSNLLAMRVAAGELAVVPAVYDVETGIIDFLGLADEGLDAIGGPSETTEAVADAG